MRLLLNAAHKLTHNWGIAIILLSLAINILLIPLYNLAEKWRNADKVIQAKMADTLADIKACYTGKERYFYTQTTYRVNNYSPFSSVKASMGFLIQIPFFFAAFHFLANYEPLVGVSFGILKDLSQPDTLLGGINLLPFVMTAVNLAAAGVYLKNATKNEKYQLWGMALLFLVLLYTQAAGLLLYWTMNNVFALVRGLVAGRIKLPGFVKKLSVQKFAETIYPKGKWVDYLIAAFYLLSVLFLILGIKSNFITEKTLHNLESYFFIYFIAISLALNLILLLKTTALKHSKSKLQILIYFTSIIISAACLFMLLRSEFIRPTYAFLATTLLIVSNIAMQINLVHNKQANHNLFKNENPYIFAAPYFLLTLTIFIINPISLFNVSDQTKIDSSLFFEINYLVFLAVFLFGLCFYKLANLEEKSLLSKVIAVLAGIVTVYSFALKGDFGVLDNFVFHEPDKLNMSSNVISLEILALTLYSFFIFLYFEQIKNIVKNISLILSATLITFLFISFSNQKHILLGNNNIDIDFDSEVTNLFSFSKEKNILIIFLDAFPGGHMQKIINERPDITSELTGFTWYRNTLSTTNYTYSSSLAMVGGHNYALNNLTIKEYESVNELAKKAYSVFPNSFKQDEWNLSYYKPYAIKEGDLPDTIYNSSFDFGRKYLLENNIINEKKLEYGSIFTEIFNFQAVSLFNSSPFFLKKTIYNDKNWLFSKQFLRVLFYDDNFVVKAEDWGFLNAFNENLKFNSSKKTLKYFHLLIPHHPSVIDESGDFDSFRANRWTESYITMSLLNSIFRQLKSNGTYDNTKVIIISDHGWESEFAWLGFSYENNQKIPAEFNNGRGYPLLMVKDFNGSGELLVSNRFMSNADMASIVCSAIENGCDITDLDPTKYNQERPLYISEFQYKGFSFDKKFIIGDIYKVKDNIFDPDNWTKVFDGETQTHLEE